MNTNRKPIATAARTVRRLLAVVVLMCAATVLTRPAAWSQKPRDAPHASNLTIAVAELSGADKDLGRFIADTLLTDLAQSQHLALVERAEIGRALTELKLQSTGLIEPQQVKELGKIVGADRLIVGSYLIYDGRIFINARILDVPTGRLMVGGGANVSGPRGDLFALVHQLANQFHERITGQPLATEDEEPLDTAAPNRAALPSKRTGGGASNTSRRSGRSPLQSTDADSQASDAGDALLGHLIPYDVDPKDAVTSSDLSLLIVRLARRLGRNANDLLADRRSETPATRLRVLTLLVRTLLTREQIASYSSETRTINLPADIRKVPAVGLSYLLAAIDRGWWPRNESVRSNDTATWGFLSELLARMPQTSSELAMDTDRDDNGTPDPLSYQVPSATSSTPRPPDISFVATEMITTPYSTPFVPTASPFMPARSPFRPTGSPFVSVGFRRGPSRTGFNMMRTGEARSGNGGHGRTIVGHSRTIVTKRTGR